MTKSIASWVGKNVDVTLRIFIGVRFKGKLMEVDESGILLEMPKGQTFIPVTSILHISLLKVS